MATSFKQESMKSVPNAGKFIETHLYSTSTCLKQAGFDYTLKVPNKIAADDILISYFYLLKKIRLDFSCESSA